MARDIEEVAADLTRVGSILHVLSLYAAEAMSDKPQVDIVNPDIMGEALAGVGYYAERLSDDLSEIAEETLRKG